MYSNTRYSEESFTYKEMQRAREVVKEEIRRAIMQKAIGLVFILVGVAELWGKAVGLCDQGGLFLLAIPCGLYFLFTREEIL